MLYNEERYVCLGLEQGYSQNKSKFIEILKEQIPALSAGTRSEDNAI
jgi:hypothetical protein